MRCGPMPQGVTGRTLGTIICMMTEWEKRLVKDMLKHKKKIMNSVCLENRSKSPSDAKLPAKTTC